MRDLQRLEKLSSATALGLWAEDVILALDRAARLGQRDAGDAELLEKAAAVLNAALGQSEEPLAVPSAKAIAATDMALDVAENLAEGRSPKETQAMLRGAAEILHRAAADDLGEEAEEEISPVIDFFGAVGRHQLAAGNSVSGYSRGMRSWMATPKTFSYS